MILVFLAEGFEEIEAITTIDILRRADLNVRSVSITEEKMVTGSHGIGVMADMLFNEIDINEVKALVLPGGMPGTTHLGQHEGLKTLLLSFVQDETKTVAAICAAPSILGELDLVKGKKVTCYPGFEGTLVGARISRKPVVRDGNLITADGPGHAREFALRLVDYLGNSFAAAELTKELNV